jgi:predicted CopG family antitoxin
MKMVQQSRKTIVVTEQIFETLRKMGTVTESFNDVITRLIQNQKAAMSGQSLAGSSQNKAARLQSTETLGAAESSDV